jgi:hypothetical protein
VRRLVGVENEKGRWLACQRPQDFHQNDVLYDVGEVACMKGVTIAQHYSSLVIVTVPVFGVPIV